MRDGTAACIREGVGSNHSLGGARRLRVGYMSRRFNDYPGTQMMLRVFGSHNRSNVAVIAIATGPDDAPVSSAPGSGSGSGMGAYRTVIRDSSDAVVDASELPLVEAVELLLELQLDVIIDYGNTHMHN